MNTTRLVMFLFLFQSLFKLNAQECSFVKLVHIEIDSLFIENKYSHAFNNFRTSKCFIDVLFYVSYGGRGGQLIWISNDSVANIKYMDEDTSYTEGATFAVDKEISNLKGNYLGDCGYSSSNKLYILIVKSEGVVMLRVVSSTFDFSSFGNQSLSNLTNEITGFLMSANVSGSAK